MKIGKKVLSVLLTIVMVVGTLSVSFSSLVAYAAVPTVNEIKTALQGVDTSNLSTGDGRLLKAAELIYSYAESKADKSTNSITGSYNSPSLSAKPNNSVVNLNSTLKNDLGAEYNTLIDRLLPTSGVYDDSSYTSSNCADSGSYKGLLVSWDAGRVNYKLTSGVTASSTVTASIDGILMSYSSVADIPESILTSATYNYIHSVKQGEVHTSSGTLNKTWSWKSFSWHYLSSITRTNALYNTTAKGDLNAFNDYFTAALLATPKTDLCLMSASDNNALIAANNAAYARLNGYSANVKNYFFDMDKVDTFMADCLFAQKVINAQPAINALNAAMAAGYDTLDLEEMNSIYTARKPNLDFLVGANNSDPEVIPYVAANFEGFDTFSLPAAEAFMVQLDKDIQLYKIRDIKAKVDALRALYPDADAIRLMETNELLWNCYDLAVGYYNTLTGNTFTAAYVAEVFADGLSYIAAMRDEFKFEWDYRGAEVEYESYYSWFLPLVYADLTAYTTEEITGSEIDEAVPNIFNAVAKDAAFEAMYASFEALIGDAAMKEIFGDEENALGYIIDDYIARLYSVLLARLTSEVAAAVGYYDAYNEINLDNFATVKDSIGFVETSIWDFLNENKPSLISEELKEAYESLSGLLETLAQYIAGGGLADIEQKHLHDENGVYITREPTAADAARDIAQSEVYNVDEAVVLETMEKLDAFLTSNDFARLVDLGDDEDRDVVLSDYIKELLAEKLYTDKLVSGLMNLVYPALLDALEDLFADLPDTYVALGFFPISLVYKELPQVISDLGLGLYPNQVPAYIADGYGTVKAQLAAASTWEELENEDGDLPLDWGIDSIDPEDYETTAEYLAAKKAKFMGAMSEALDAVLPVIRVLLADWGGLNAVSNNVAVAAGFLNADLVVTADGCAGYSDLVVPILEALGCDGIESYETVNGYTTSRQFVDAIFNPLIGFIENTLANKPLDTICSILPNLAYAISFDKVLPLLDKLNINIKYLATALGFDVINESKPLVISELLGEDTLDLGFDISSFNGTLQYLLGSLLEGFDASKLPIINSGTLVTYASLDTDAPTLRHTGDRLNFTTDKADMFMAILNYLVKCLGDDTFVKSIISILSSDDGEEGEPAPEPEPELSDTLKTILNNVIANPDLAIAAVIELLNQTEYDLDSYTWYDGTVGGTVEGLTPAALVYLSETNDWTKATADYVDANINEILDAVLAAAGKELDISAELSGLINGIFTNGTVTSLAKLLGKTGGLSDTISGLLKDELGIDLAAFAAYADIAEDYNWGFADGDRDGFIEALIGLLSPLEALYGFLFTDENITLFKDNAGNDIVTLYGGDGYDAAIAPLLEALGCDVTPVDEYKAAVAADRAAALRIVVEAITAKLDEILADPIYGILNLLPGALYFITSNGLSTVVRNLLHPIYVLLDTIRPVYPLDIQLLINEALNGKGLDVFIDLDNINLAKIIEIVEGLTGLKLDVLKVLIEDVSMVVRTPYTSESAFVGEGCKGAYIPGSFDRADMITVLISYVLEALAVDENAAVLDSLIGTEGFASSLLALFEGADPEMKSINWMYYFGEDFDFSDYNFETGINIEPTIYAVTYPNNWTEASADYVNTNLDSIVSLIVGLVDENYDDLAALLGDKLDIYNAANVEAIASLLGGLIGGIDAKLLEAVGTVLGVDLSVWQGYTASPDIDTAEEFAAGIADVLEPVSGILDWLLFGKDYRFFTGTQLNENGEYVYNDIITIKGAEGYRYGLIPVLEALGCENLPAFDAENALEGALNSLFARLDEILADPANELLAILPNLIYFINANGVNASIYNALAAVYTLVDTLNANFGTGISVDGIIGADLSGFSFEGIIGYAENATGLDLSPVTNMFSYLCVGTIASYESLSGEYAYTMSYSDELDRKDMLTLLITVFVEAIKLGDNEQTLRGLIGDGVYDAVLNVLKLRQFSMQQPTWILTEYAGTGKAFSAMQTSQLYSGYDYGMVYTQDMAQHIAGNIDQFADNFIYLLGIELEGESVDDLEELLNKVVNGAVYTDDNAQWLLDKVLSFVSSLDALAGSAHIKALIKSSLGVDLDAWDSYSVPVFENDRALFIQAICDILAPLYPVLKWALCNEDFTFFVDEDKNNLITLLGAEGYAYGIIPLLEALGCENVMPAEAYYAAAEADPNALITNILNTLLNRVDEIMADPADEILEMLPAVIYFINSNGLDTCFKNALHAVYGILAAIEPLVKVDLYELINIRLDEMTFESIYKYLLDLIAEKTGYELTALEGDALVELTVGRLVPYTSANGETYYTMEYQAQTAKAEMVTITERLLISFVLTDDNTEKLLGILKDRFGMSEDAEKNMRGFLKMLTNYTTTTKLGMESALSAVYYVFYGANIAGDNVSSAMKDVNKKWKEILQKLNKSNDPNATGLGTILGEFLDMTLDGIIDSEGIAPDGFIVMFRKISELFNKIIEFFKRLFNR